MSLLSAEECVREFLLTDAEGMKPVVTVEGQDEEEGKKLIILVKIGKEESSDNGIIREEVGGSNFRFAVTLAHCAPVAVCLL
jgi:hypothetical protein